MTLPAVPLVCVVSAYLLVYLPHVLASTQRAKLPGGFDNKHPRDQSARLDGWAKRAVAAHQNGHETFAPFAVAVVAASIGSANPHNVATLAVAFVVLRVLYIAAYIGNAAPVRSLIWTTSLAVTCALFLLPLFS